MTDIDHVEELENGGWIEYRTDGSIQVKDGEGKFRQDSRNYIPPSVAAGRARGRTRKKFDEAFVEADDILAVVPEAVKNDPRKVWIIRHLASEIALGGSGTAANVKELVKLIELGGQDSEGFQRPKPGQVCPNCGQAYIGELDLAGAAFVLAALGFYDQITREVK